MCQGWSAREQQLCSSPIVGVQKCIARLKGKEHSSSLKEAPSALTVQGQSLQMKFKRYGRGYSMLDGGQRLHWESSYLSNNHSILCCIPEIWFCRWTRCSNYCLQHLCTSMSVYRKWQPIARNEQMTSCIPIKQPRLIDCKVFDNAVTALLVASLRNYNTNKYHSCFLFYTVIDVQYSMIKLNKHWH